MNSPLVSCICPTYNRPPSHQHLVEEAIESFLRQDYPYKELIVLNDTPDQELRCEAAGVTIINVPRRFRTLGEKRNAAIGMSQGDLIALWDDDDISLPWRLSYSVERLGDADYFNPRSYWFLPTTGLQHDHPVGYAHNASLFRRSAFEEVGLYLPISLGDDALMDKALAQRENIVDPGNRGSAMPTMSEWFYIYRWGVSPNHVSSVADTNDGRYIITGTNPVISGTFDLLPHWRTDYLAMTREVLAGLEVTPA